MSYGHRLNLEDIFFELAETKFSEAQHLKDKVKDRDPETAQNTSFMGYPTGDGLAAISIAVVSWATSLEAFTNQVWNIKVTPTLPSDLFREMALRQLSTKGKLKELLNQYSYNLGTAPWWADIGALYELRNQLVHYKDTVSYQGFKFSAPLRKKLSEENVLKVRGATIKCVEVLGGLAGVRTSFVQGVYETETILV